MSRKHQQLTPRQREARMGWTFISLWVIGFLVFSLVPLIQTFVFSLNVVTVTASGITLNFVQMANYTRALLTDPTFVELLIGYVIETALSVPIVLIFSLTIALLLNLKFKFKGFFRTIFFLPVVITSGPVIQELTAQGATRVAGLADSATIALMIQELPSVLRAPVEYLLSSFILILWFSGVQILIYLSSLQKIDRSVYEAAAIDGANAWESFWLITFPALSTTTLINAFYTIVTLSHFSENKVIKYIHSQTYSVQGGIGYASAMSFIYLLALVIILALVTLIISYSARKSR